MPLRKPADQTPQLQRTGRIEAGARPPPQPTLPAQHPVPAPEPSSPTGLTPSQKRAYLLADNKLALDAGWDLEMLGAELADLQALGVDLALTGFDASEILSLTHHVTPGLTDPDEVPEARRETVSRPGDLWLLKHHRLLCGDSTRAEDVAKVLGEEKPHLLVTDPPYGVSYDPAWRQRLGISALADGKVMNDDRADWREAFTLFDGDVAYVWHGGLHAGEVAESLAASGFVLRGQIIWDKTRLVIGRGDYHWQHEPLWYVVRKGRTGHWSGDRKQTSVWAIAHASRQPAMGPRSRWSACAARSRTTRGPARRSTSPSAAQGPRSSPPR